MQTRVPAEHYARFDVRKVAEQLLREGNVCSADDAGAVLASPVSGACQVEGVEQNVRAAVRIRNGKLVNDKFG